jgi:hypothetical protein
MIPIRSKISNVLDIGDGTVDNDEFNKLNNVSGDLVGTTGTQTLTNKTINSSNNTVTIPSNDLDNVTITSVADQDTLQYDSASAEWINRPFWSTEVRPNTGAYVLTTGYTNISGLSLSLPVAGTYMLTLSIRGESVSNRYLVARMTFGFPTEFEISDSVLLIGLIPFLETAGNYQMTASRSVVYQALGTTLIRAQAFKSGTGNGRILDDTNGFTLLSAYRIA